LDEDWLFWGVEQCHKVKVVYGERMRSGTDSFRMMMMMMMMDDDG
jgi:hypothetical protein